MALIPNNRQIFNRVFISRPDGVTYEDVSSYVTKIELERGDVSAVGTGQTGADGVIQLATIELQADGSQVDVYWQDTIAREETEVVGDETFIVGDEEDGAERLINLLFNTTEYFTRNSFAPLDKHSKLNWFNGEYAPLLWPNRTIYIRTAIQSTQAQESGTTMRLNRNIGTGDGVTTNFSLGISPVLPDSVTVYVNGAQVSNYTVDYNTGSIIFTSPPAVDTIITADYTFYKTRFVGYLGEDIRVSNDKTTATILCSDIAGILQWTYIETPKTYGSNEGVPAETVIRQILDDNGLTDISFNVPVSPGFNVLPYELKYKSVWNAIQEIVSQFGWFFGTRYNPDTNDIELYLLEPPRDKDSSTADYHLTAEDDIYLSTLNISWGNVRNVVKITYRDIEEGTQVTLDPDDPNYAPYLKDQASIDEFGRRLIEIIEKDTSLIDTEAEALAFGQAILKDLKDITGVYKVTMPLFIDLELFDGLNIDDPLISSDTDFYGVESIRETYIFGEDATYATEVICSGKVTGGRQRWVKMHTSPGYGEPISGPEIVDNKIVVYVAAADSPQAKRNLASYFCDGIDDQEQIQKAIDSLPSGGTVHLLEGTYIISSAINLKNDKVIQGSGSSTILRLKDNLEVDTSIFITDYFNTGSHNISIFNLTLDGNRSNNVGIICTGLSLRGGRNIKIQNVAIKNCNHGIYLDCSSNNDPLTNVVILNCSMTYCGAAGLYVPFTASNDSNLINNITISGCLIERNDSYGCILPSLSNITVSTIQYNGVAGLDVRGKNTTVTNNIVNKNEGPGIIVDSESAYVSGNTVLENGRISEDTWANIFVASNSANAIIQNNVCRKGTTIQTDYGIHIQFASNVLVTNNDCYQGGSTAGIFDEGNNTNFGAGNRNNDGTWSTIPN